MRESVIVKQVTSIERKCCPTLMIDVLRFGQCIIVYIIARGPDIHSHPRQTSWGLPVPGDFLKPKYEKIGHRQAGGMHPPNTNVI
jgi:hypothetical protein